MVEKAEADGVWLSQFSFTLQPRKLQDFAPMCHYHQTSPDSPFTRNGYAHWQRRMAESLC